jgi:outer membrane receptor protein involved in Fe transport
MRLVKHIILFLGLFILTNISFAGNTGKISGYVKDKQTGEPLIGANVMISGTRLGAAAGNDGYFYIIGIPPGKHEVKVSYMGYHQTIIKDVLVQVDLTTKLNFELVQDFIEMEAIVAVAERALVQKDITSTRIVTTRDEIAATPGIESVTDVLKMRAGAVFDQVPTRLSLGEGTQLQVQDESLKNIHIRGGRGGEILFMVDGMPVTHPIYGGRDVLDLNVEDVEQMELLMGAFNAEYGQAQSGVVNITTRSGSENMEAGVEYKRDFEASFVKPHNSEYVSVHLGGPLRFNKNKNPFGNMYYFISANLRRNDGPFNLNREKNDLSLFNLFNLKQRQDNISNMNMKFTWQLSDQDRMIINYHGSWKNWNNPYDWSYKNYPNNTAEYFRNTQNWNLRYNHIFSKSTFLNMNFGFLDVQYNGSLDGEKNPSDYWIRTEGNAGQDSIFTTVQIPRSDPATGFFTEDSYQAIWRDDVTKTYTAKAELVSQLHRDHIIKTGFSMQYNDLRYVDIQDGAFKLSNYGIWKYQGGDYFDPPPGPFPEFGLYRWFFHTYPLVGDFFIQDKFEKESLILNVGVRLDWVHLGKQVNDETYKNKWEAATGIEPDWNLFKYTISPRFGISFPISEYMVLFFSYGHFTQLPEMDKYYRDPWSGSFTGNPHLGYEKTILYEFGFTQQFFENWSIDVKSYGKDISDGVGQESLLASLGLPVQLNVNNGYGRARGLEFELHKRYDHFTMLDLTYALQWANGYSSSAYSDFIRTSLNLPKPIRERPLDYDVRHQVMLNASLIAGEGKHLNLFGIRFPDKWNITLLARFSSGKPYTPGTVDPLEQRVRENGETMPYSISSDLKINKSFNIPFGTLSVFMDIFSLFNRRNAINIYNWTGEPIKYGDVRGGEKEIISWRERYASMSPGWWTSPRHIQIGARFNF